LILEIAVEPAVVDIILGVEAEVKNARWTVCETVVIGDLSKHVCFYFCFPEVDIYRYMIRADGRNNYAR
jgi:hypothetical protein